jgi:hypothetical protein
MNKRLISLLPAILTWLALGFTPALAQTVSVQAGDQTGHGFIFRHAAQCYVVMPKHVAAGKRRVTIFSAAPVVHAGAIIETPFWEGLDLAIGIVRGAIDARCVQTLDDLAATKSTADGGAVELLRLRDTGEPERVAMIVTKGDYLTLSARVTDEQAEIFKGTSGAFLFAGGVPIGMVTDAPTTKEGVFVRMEEIHMNLTRRLNRRAGFVAAKNDAQQTTQAVQNGLPFVLQRADLAPTYPDFSSENLGTDGSYVFDLTRPNTIAYKIEGDASAVLSAVYVRSDPDADYVLPKGIRVTVSSKPDGSRPRQFLAGNMGLDGVFSSRRQPSRVRWVFVTIISGWETGPIGLDAIAFE